MSGMTELPGALGPDLQNEIVEVEKATRIRYWWGKRGLINYNNGDNKFEQRVTVNGIFNADSTFFSMYSFQFIYGNPATALKEPYTAVITESIAKKMFNNEYPIGKEIKRARKIHTITGVIKDVNNFHMLIDVVCSFSSLKDLYEQADIKWDRWEGWGAPYHPTYVMLAPNVNPDLVSEKITALWKEKRKNISPERELSSDELKLRPLKDIYFYGKTKKEFNYVLHGDINLIAGLSLIALLILLLACVNFINLNTTRTLLRAREVGIRKIAGSAPINIFIQFCGEIVSICLLVFVLSIALVYAILPYFNNLILTELLYSELFNIYNLAAIASSFLVVTFLAGVLPSWSLSVLKPAIMLKNIELKSSSKGKLLRRVLLTLQYGITIIVLAGTLLVHKQIYYMKNSDPGFNMSDVFGFGFPYAENKSKMDVFRNRVLEHPDILKASYTQTIPGMNYEPSFGSFSFEGKNAETSSMYIYPEFLDLLEIPIIEGRNFMPDNKADKYVDGNILNRVLVNETAVKEYGLKNPVGTTGKFDNKQVKIIGVVKDFHGNSMKAPIPPTIFTHLDMAYSMLIKCTPGTINDVQEYIDKITLEILNIERKIGKNGLYEFYLRQYESEEQLGKIFTWFSFLTVLIAALGLYGISINAIDRRIKEIGIRKANGASSWSILFQLQLYFSNIIFWSGIFALPVAWYLCFTWIKSYPYKTSLSWWVFAGSFVLAILIAIVTISWKTWSAANSNPVKALKYE